MKLYILTLLFLVLCLVGAQNDEFPEDFQFGVGSSAYQIEGAYETDGKGESIWDFFTANNADLISDQSNGQIACDAYSKTTLDVQLIRNMSVNYYSFSLSWSRLFPKGYSYNRNDKGFEYYDNLINELLESGIEPFVTLYHWDLPQSLHELGGWPNPIMADIFAEYATKVFAHFGDRVKKWITFNDPYHLCEQGYSQGILAPGYRQMGIGGYLCGHTVLRAHAKVYHLYHNNYDGKIGIAVHGAWAEPESQEATRVWMEMTFGWFANPIYSSTGDYPDIMKQRIEQLSNEQGFRRNRLPSFSSDELTSLKGAADFLGLNHYGSYICSEAAGNLESPSHAQDIGTECVLSENLESASAASGLQAMLKWIQNSYDDPEVIITGNGYADDASENRDCDRISYHNSYLEALLRAIHEDECRVTAYTAWSVMDSFEWQYGYTHAFGLIHVDFTNTQRPRFPKMSSYVYRNIIQTRKIDNSYTPDGYETCGACSLLISTTNKLMLAILVSLFVYINTYI